MFTVHHFYSLGRLSLLYQMSYKLKQRSQGSYNYIGLKLNHKIILMVDLFSMMTMQTF